MMWKRSAGWRWWRWSGQAIRRERGVEMKAKNSWAQVKKDNSIRLSHKAVVSTVTWLRRSKCERACASLPTGEKSPRGKWPCDAWSSVEGRACSGADLVCILMMLALHENFLCMQSTSVPKTHRKNAALIVFLHTQEYHFSLLIIF